MHTTVVGYATMIEHRTLKGARVCPSAPISPEQALALANDDNIPALVALANAQRDIGFPSEITYSRKVFIPLTELCRDVCHYCTFAKAPSRVDNPYLSIDSVLAVARAGAQQGCREALFTLGEKPELRYPAARRALSALGFDSTLEYLAYAARRVLSETGLLPHINAGNMTLEDMQVLRDVSPSMGLMLESASPRLCQKGMPHYGSPDKAPALRLQTLELAGRARIPFTTGILIGIGETRRERIESMLAIREIHQRHGHIQEVIIQNFRAKEGTKMASAPEPDLEDLAWTIAVARLIFGPEMSLQAPPNLSPGVLEQLIGAGINDWGGISPVTRDHVNPEAPWPQLKMLASTTAGAGKRLHQRLTIYPAYVRDLQQWVAEPLRSTIRAQVDGDGYPRDDQWLAGSSATPPPAPLLAAIRENGSVIRILSPEIKAITARAVRGERLEHGDVVRLFQARDGDFAYVCQAADELRQQINGNDVSFVVNRNINYTNICTFKCSFCAFSKGKSHENLRGKPYDLPDAEITRRVKDALARGATEVCMQGGIHPHYSGQKYLDIVGVVKAAAPNVHIHAFSPLEVWHGADTLGISVAEFLTELRDAGLSTLPGTAAEILDDEVRQQICPDKLASDQWLSVIETAHRIGLRTTATIMFGHVDTYADWATHLLKIRDLQTRTGGFTEFVPLPFVAKESPMFRRGLARPGPTFREAILMHATARLVLAGHIDNIQASWVKMGPAGVAASLSAGANDLGGTLMDESITRAAGADYGQEFNPQRMRDLVASVGRQVCQRDTLYRRVAGTLPTKTIASDRITA